MIHNHIFTDEQEESLAENIRENYINQGILFTNQDFWELMMQVFLKAQNDDENYPIFNVSAHFMRDFCKRCNISSDGTKCLLYLIAKCDTTRCEKSQLGDTVYHFTNHSSKAGRLLIVLKNI